MFADDRKTRPLTSQDIAALCAVASVSAPTARRYLLGLPVKPLCLARLERAAERLGIQPAAEPQGYGPVVVAMRDREPEASK